MEKTVFIIIERHSHGIEAIMNVYETLERALQDQVFEDYEEEPQVLKDPHNGEDYAMSESFYILEYIVK